ncbi:gamma-glutamyltranspeptidase / glutathione hydrolase [Roseomonas rosea]|uniref:Gamma-glutamyltranspeptidase / glutathione hydrolase n=1 Tax=Muricoccus roseus TaxID=198092 RepID=A0A1M6NBX9_9PROT|nr:gamma-glutamyltransferase [Roseomonas rosea]SHJ93225.1 gamma-glutamyltranspeptidase / glutathione hydrolase [Roseomonas rosea]
MPELAAYAPPLHTSQHWALSKPGASGRGGIVASQSRAAAEVGVAVLEAGGNAADAAVAAAFALATAEPWNSGLGGIGFAMVHKPGSAPQVVDFGPVAPAGVDPSAYPLTGKWKQDLFAWPEVVGDVNIHGPLSFVIPSSVAGYDLLRERFGTGMGLDALLGPAIALARRGLAQDWFTTLKVSASAKVLRLYEESARIYLPDGLPPNPPYQGLPGFLKQGALAETLERLRDHGLRDFYEGGLAADLVADIKALGGVVGAADLAGCRASVRESMPIAWRGTHTIHTAGGLTAAPTMAAVVAAMNGVPVEGGPGAGWYGGFAQAMRRAYAERLAGLGAGEAAKETAETCTTHLTVCDGEGMMVSVTTTLLSSMGSRVVLPRTGVLMNNGMMWFDPQPGSANAIRPGARPLCNMSPVTVTRAGEDTAPILAGGASGGRRILASVCQMLAFQLDFGMDPEEAAHQPRIDVSGPDAVTADRRLPAEVLEALAADGGLETVEHAVLPVNFACPNFIARDADGMAQGISDVMSPWSAALAAGPVRH